MTFCVILFYFIIVRILIMSECLIE